MARGLLLVASRLRPSGCGFPAAKATQLEFFVCENSAGTGTFTKTSSPVMGVTLPTALALHSPVPNPFRSGASIRYDLPWPAHVRLDVLDVAGRRVRTLRDGREEAGFRSVVWDGRDSGGQRVGSGVYFYALDTGQEVFRRKMVILR